MWLKSTDEHPNRGRCTSAANWQVMHKGAAMATVTRRYYKIYTLALEYPKDKLEIDWQHSNSNLANPSIAKLRKSPGW